MALTLPPALLAAQSAAVRQPVIELKASSFDEYLPFNGGFVDELFHDEYALTVLLHSSGRICVAYVVNEGAPADNGYIQYVYTNADKSEFNYVKIELIHVSGKEELAMCELKSGNIGLIYKNSVVVAFELSPNGLIVQRKEISALAGGYGFGLLSRNEDYLIMFSKPSAAVVPVLSGGYTNTQSKEYTLTVTKDGTNADAEFKYENHQGVSMGGGAVIPLEHGLNVSFPLAFYFTGQEFYFTAYSASYSSSQIEINNIPIDGSVVSIAGVSYTFKDALMDGGAAYEVKIDQQSKEITLENLNSAINKGAYDESGEGERYGNGTLANAAVTSSRARGDVKMFVKAKAYGNITYRVTFGAGCGLIGGDIMGGKNSSVSAISTLPSCKTYVSISADFMNWSVAKEQILSGVVAARDKQHYYFTLLNNGNVMLWFDCITAGRTNVTAVYNIFYAISADGGKTFSEAYAITDYNNPQAIALNARCVQKTEHELTLAYNEIRGCMRIGATAPGNPFTFPFDNITGGIVFNVDFIRRRAYISADAIESGGGSVIGLLEIDIDEWRILRHWNENTVPAFPEMMRNSKKIYGTFSVWLSLACKSNGRYQVWVKPGLRFIFLLDVINNKMVSIHFSDYDNVSDAHYKLKSNVNISGSSISGGHSPLGAYVDDANNKVWVVIGKDISDEIGGSSEIEFASLDLEQIFNHEVNRYDVSVVAQLKQANKVLLKWLDFSAEYNAWLFNFCYDNDAKREVVIVDAETYGKLYTVSSATCRNFPVRGLFSGVYRNGKLYGGTVASDDEYNYKGMQGLCIVDLSSMQANYYIPPGIVRRSGGFEVAEVTVTDAEQVIFGCYASPKNSIYIYDVPAGAWQILNSDTVAGFIDNNAELRIRYDETSHSIYLMGIYYYARTTGGLQLINIDGKVEQLVYRELHIDQDMTVSIGEAKRLTKGNAETNGHIFYADDQLYAFWQRCGNYRKINWDKDAGLIDLSKYLLRGSEISIAKSIDGTPNSLSFELANGHLFDQTNTRSMLSSYLKKGKKITLRLGENTNGMLTYQSFPDTFVVTGSSLTFARGTYPTIKIECHDRRYLFENIRIVTPYYSAVAPHLVLNGILQEYGGYEQSNIVLPAVDETGAVIKGQFIDKALTEIIEDVCSRFGYFLAVRSGDIITWRKINLEAEPSHVYSGVTWLVNYSPDDSFSDMTNKITVVGESADKTAVTMPEELVAQDSGTIGWYKRKKTKRLYYSDDGGKVCVNPRLVKLESATNIAFKLAGKVKEYIEGVDETNNTYVDVAVEAPDLTYVFLAALAMIITAKNMPPVIVPPDPQTGMGGGTAQSKEAAILESSGMWLAFQCLGAIANYQFEIYAQPISYVHRSFQYSVLDDDLIRALKGTIIEKKIDDTLCYTVENCRSVAELEMKITKAQRNRVKMTKVTHLQDEVGDVIEINHPYNKLQQRVFVTNITRRILIPAVGSADGHILDDVEGWKL